MYDDDEEDGILGYYDAIMHLRKQNKNTIMTTETKPPRTRTPRNSDSVTKGALALPLAERVDLKKALEVSIDSEVQDLKAKAEAAANIAGGNA